MLDITLESQLTNILTMIWQISVGLLALFGLVGIGVSLNCQKKIDKAWDIYWDWVNSHKSVLQGRDTESIRTNFIDIQSLYRLYRLVTAPIDSGIIKDILSFVPYFGLVIIISWLSGIIIMLLLHYPKNWVIFSIILILCCSALVIKICAVINKLSSIPDAAGLPSIEKLLDVSDSNHKVDILPLIVSSVHMQIKPNREGDLILRIELPLPYYNYTIFPRLTLFLEDGSEVNVKGDKITIDRNKAISQNQSFRDANVYIVSAEGLMSSKLTIDKILLNMQISDLKISVNLISKPIRLSSLNTSIWVPVDCHSPSRSMTFEELDNWRDEEQRRDIIIRIPR